MGYSYDYGYGLDGLGSSLEMTGFFTVLALILAIVATVLAFIFIVPEKRREKLNSFGKFLHDTCNFRYLVIEKILQALYILLTAFVMLNGFFMLFQSVGGIWLGGYGILVIVLGPIAIRLSYELLMMVVILVKNVISINSKLGDNGKSADEVFSAPDMSDMRKSISKMRERIDSPDSTDVPSKPLFCVNCGAHLNDDGSCPNCNNDL